MSQSLPIPQNTREPQTFVASAGQTVFTATFPLQLPGDETIDLSLNGGASWTRLTAGVDYDVTVFGQPGAFEITRSSPSVAGHLIRMGGDAPVSDTTDFSPGNTIKRDGLNAKFDRLTIWMQEFRRDLGAAGEALQYAEQIEVTAGNVEDNRILTQDALAAALAAMSSIVPTEFDTMALALAYHPAVAPTRIRLLGRYAIDDEGGALYKKVVSEPTHDGKFPLVLADGITAVWYEIAAKKFITPQQLGPIGASDDAGTILKAIETADALGVVLNWNSAKLNLASAVSASLTKPMAWSSAGAEILWTGAGDVATAINIALPIGEVTHRLDGTGLLYDGAHKTGLGVQFLQTTLTADMPYLRVKGLKARRCHDKAGAGTAAAGMCARGGFRRVLWVDCKSTEHLRRTGSSSGITGILTINHPATGAYCLETINVRPRVSDITHEDGVTSIDMDAIGVFANPDVSTGLGYSSAKVTDPRINKVWGRHAKFQTMHAEVLGGYATLDEAPSGGRTMPVYAQQSGTMLVKGGVFNVFVSGTFLVNFNSGDAGAPISSSWESSAVRIDGAASIEAALYVDLSSTKHSVLRAQGVRVLGELRNFALVRTNGTDKDALDLDGVVVDNLTEAMVRVTSGSGTPPYRARVTGRNCDNTGTVRPFVRQNVMGVAAQAIVDAGASNRGFEISASISTLNPSQSGISVESLVGPDMTGTGGDAGTRRSVGFGLENTASFLLPKHGSSGACLVRIKPLYGSREAYATFSYDEAAFKSISVGTDFNIGTTSDPGSGLFRVWRDSGNANRIRIQNNSGGDRGFIAEMLG